MREPRADLHVATHVCRVCQSDADCDSEVCDPTGACLDAATIIYAEPQGSPAGDCGTQANPCSLARAFTQVDPTHATVKLRPGDYSLEATIPLVVPAGKTDDIDGTGAMIHTDVTSDADAAFNVTGPGKLHIKGVTFIRGETISSGNTGIVCGDL